MNKTSNHSRSSLLLLENDLASVDGKSRPSGTTILSRALCRFRPFVAPAGMRRSEVDKAARLYAEAHAPFSQPGILLLRSPYGAEIWYWDEAKIKTNSPAPEVSPESVWRRPFTGWRIVACAEGFEAQYGDGKSVLASTWRREEFTPQHWTAFALSVEGAEIEAPATPPEPVQATLGDRSWRRRRIGPRLTWGDVQIYTTSAAIAASALATMFLAQAATFAALTERWLEQSALLEQRLSEPDLAEVDRNIRAAREFSAASPGGVLGALADALSVLKEFGLEPRSWRADGQEVQLLIEEPITAVRVSDLMAALEGQPRLCEATPEIMGQGSFEIRIQMVRSSQTCGQIERGRR